MPSQQPQQAQVSRSKWAKSCGVAYALTKEAVVVVAVMGFLVTPAVVPTYMSSHMWRTSQMCAVSLSIAMRVFMLHLLLLPLPIVVVILLASLPPVRLPDRLLTIKLVRNG